MTSTKPPAADVPTPEEELQGQNAILSATVAILCEEVDHFRSRAQAAEAEVRRLHTLIAYGSVSPKHRNDAVNALR